MFISVLRVRGIEAAIRCNFIKKETLVQVFSCEFCEIFQNTFFIEHIRTIASVSSIVEPDLHDYVALYCYCIKLLSSITPLTCLYRSTSFTFRVIPYTISDSPKEFEQKTHSPALQFPE